MTIISAMLIYSYIIYVVFSQCDKKQDNDCQKNDIESLKDDAKKWVKEIKRDAKLLRRLLGE